MARVLFRIASAAIALGMVSACANTGEGVAPVTVPERAAGPELVSGTVISWIEQGEGFGGTNFTNIVLANGPDFKLLLEPGLLEDAEYSNEFSPYGVEFSGIAYYGCDESLPSAVERAELAALAQRAAGETVSIGSHLIVTIGERSEASINGIGSVTLRDYELTWPSLDEGYEGDDQESPRVETVTVAENIGLVISSGWDDTGTNVVAGIAIASEAAPLSLRHASALDNCRALLSQP